jgi:galactitol-specific phosphotransferase system IIB component
MYFSQPMNTENVLHNMNLIKMFSVKHTIRRGIMRNRYIALIFIAFLISIVIVANGIFGLGKEKVSVEDSLIKSLEGTKAQVMESTISVWSKINNSFMTEQQVEEEMKAVLANINPEKTTINMVKENDEETNKQTLYAGVGNKYYNIAVESVKTDKGGETYVVMDVSIDNSTSELVAERQKLESYFTAKNVKPKVSSCVIGVYEGRLTESEMRVKIADAMNSVKAKAVEGLDGEGLNSISAFSGNINSFVLSNNKKVNMQIAMRYSSYDAKTYIWIGSPLIHVEY